MEALLEREEEQVESWNDDRLDELSRRMDAGFEEAATKVELTAAKEEMNLRFDAVEKEMERRFDEVDARFVRFEASMENQFGRINDRLDKLLWGIGFVGLTIGLNIVADKV